MSKSPLLLSVDESKNNGQIGRIEGFIGASKQWQQRFSYDSLGRLSQASEYRGDNNQQSYLIKFDYDTFGNRYQKAANNQVNPLPYTAVEDTDISKSTNRFTSSQITYDNAGNVTVDSKFRGRQYSYDANNRQKYAALTDGTGAAWSVYNGAGQRVATISNGTTSIMVYDAGGKLVAEYGTSTSSAGGTQYVFSDHQGSTRVVTNQSGGVLSRQDYQPFGEEIYSGVGLRSTTQGYDQSDSVRQKYAGMEKDDASGMSHTLWRKYDGISGRWTSPDPYGGSMSVSSPQSFNRYSYVNNDPVNLVDPTGLMLSDIGVYQTNDPSMASRLEHQSLRDVQVSVNADYAARHNGTVSYEVNHAIFTPNPSGVSGSNLRVLATVNIHGNFEGIDDMVAALKILASRSYHLDIGNNDFTFGGTGGDSDNYLRTLNTALNAGGIGASVGQYSNVLNGMWRDNYGIWRRMTTPGNQYIGGKLGAIGRANAWNSLSTKLFWIGAFFSGYQVATGQTSGTKAAIDVGMSALGTFGGPLGAVIASIYFLIDATIGWDNIFNSPPSNTDLPKRDGIHRSWGGDARGWE